MMDVFEAFEKKHTIERQHKHQISFVLPSRRTDTFENRTYVHVFIRLVFHIFHEKNLALFVNSPVIFQVSHNDICLLLEIGLYRYEPIRTHHALSPHGRSNV